MYTLTIGVGSEHGFPLTNDRFTTAPATIPPHELRTVRIRWNGLGCSAPGVEEYLTGVSLRVRVGHFTRTENIALSSTISVVVPQPVVHPAADSCQAARR